MRTIRQQRDTAQATFQYLPHHKFGCSSSGYLFLFQQQLQQRIAVHSKFAMLRSKMYTQIAQMVQSVLHVLHSHFQISAYNPDSFQIPIWTYHLEQKERRNLHQDIRQIHCIGFPR